MQVQRRVPADYKLVASLEPRASSLPRGRSRAPDAVRGCRTRDAREDPGGRMSNGCPDRSRFFPAFKAGWELGWTSPVRLPFRHERQPFGVERSTGVEPVIPRASGGVSAGTHPPNTLSRAAVRRVVRRPRGRAEANEPLPEAKNE